MYGKSEQTFQNKETSSQSNPVTGKIVRFCNRAAAPTILVARQETLREINTERAKERKKKCQQDASELLVTIEAGEFDGGK